MERKPSIVMMSDFGIDSGLVSCMHGVVKRVDRDLEIYDISHVIESFNIVQASDQLALVFPCWPDGTVFVSVVDPGVGTSRKASVAKCSNGSYIVTPDNGTLTKVAMLYGIDEVREIDESINRWRESEEVDIFHGRDLFSYTAARLASGVISWNEVGPAYDVKDIVRYEIPPYSVEEGRVEGYCFGSKDNDFGIMTTNIPNREFMKAGFPLYEKVRVRVSDGDRVFFDEKVLFGKTFGDVAVGEPILYREVALYLGLALNMTNFARTYGIERSIAYKMEITR